jgi:hypothetical protein
MTMFKPRPQIRALTESFAPQAQSFRRYSASMILLLLTSDAFSPRYIPYPSMAPHFVPSWAGRFAVLLHTYASYITYQPHKHIFIVAAAGCSPNSKMTETGDSYSG